MQMQPVRAGLIASGAPVPLQGVLVEGTVRDFTAQLTITHRYRNLEDHPIEAVYVFPLDEGAAVHGFEAWIDGIHVIGEVKERDEAFEQYDDAIAAGHGAYLLDQERPDVFTASIGNIPAGKEVLVLIRTVAELPAEGDAVRFTLPTTVSPRYAPEEDRRGVGRPPAVALNPPVEWRVPYGLDLNLQVEMPCRIRSIESPSHAISLSMDGSKATVKLGGREMALDRDFVLDINLEAPFQPRAWIEVDDHGNYAAMLAFQPQFEAREGRSEIIFVVDRSGSMEGSSIEEAQNTLQLCLRSLPMATPFNIVGFGSGFQRLFTESRPYDERSLAEATAHVKSLRADMGGTEILEPLRAILEEKRPEGHPLQLFILTDGEVTNTDAVIQLIRRHSNIARVFTFGIGAGASHHLVRGMARAGGGAAEFIFPGERMEAKVMRHMRKALAPALTDMQVDWGSLAATQAPHQVPAIFAGGRTVIYGFLKNAKNGVVTLKAHGPDGPLTFEVPVEPSSAAPGSWMGTLAARVMIRDLEEGSSPLHDRGGSLQDRVKKDRVREEIVKLGVTYGLCSSATSFVAIEKRETPAEGKLELRRVPVALTHGWGGSDRIGRLAGAAAMPASPAPQSAPRFLSRMRSAMMDTFAEASLESTSFSRRSRSKPPMPAQRHKTEDLSLPKQERQFTRLIWLQGADGSWDPSADLADILEIPLRKLTEGVKQASGDGLDMRKAWATALSLAWLEKNAASRHEEWEMLESKALKWLAKSSARRTDGQDWLAAARAFFASP